jgi:hypothetical protein
VTAHLPYRDFLFPLNVFMHILSNEEKDVRYLHYGLFERSDETIGEAQEHSTSTLLSVLPPPPLSLLDVGIGLGTTLHCLTQAGYDAEGITPDAKQIAVARGRYPGLRIHEAAFETFVPSRRYDRVLFQESSQYIDSGRLFAKARELTGSVIVLDEFAVQDGTLHRLDRFLASAAMHGFERTTEIDLSAQAAPTIDYFLARLPRYRRRLIDEVGITNEQVDELIESGTRYRDQYQSGGYVYRLLSFRA